MENDKDESFTEKTEKALKPITDFLDENDTIRAYGGKVGAKRKVKEVAIEASIAGGSSVLLALPVLLGADLAAKAIDKTINPDKPVASPLPAGANHNQPATDQELIKQFHEGKTGDSGHVDQVIDSRGKTNREKAR
jgi:hypothetical protein